MTDGSTPRKQTIALIGLRGSGKTTIGRLLADRMGGECVDTDERIEHEAGCSIAEMFRDEGEAGFRDRERAVIACVVKEPPAVISVGGGAVLDETNAAALAAVATIVWLTASTDVLAKRIDRDPSSATTRPPLTAQTGRRELDELLTQREPVYRRLADVIVETAGKTPAEIVDVILAELNRLHDRS